MFILFKVPTLLTEYECFSPGYNEEQEYEDGNKYSLILEVNSISVLQIKYTLKNCQPLLLQTMRKLLITTKLMYKMFSFFLNYFVQNYIP